MRHSRTLRVVGNGLLLVLFTLAAVAAVRFLLETVDARGWDPKAFFGLLLVVGAFAMVWRSTLDLRNAVRRKKA